MKRKKARTANAGRMAAGRTCVRNPIWKKKKKIKMNFKPKKEREKKIIIEF